MKYITSLLGLLMMNIATPLIAEEPPAVTLMLEPQQCVSLRQGNTCFADVKLSFQASQTADYCLFSESSRQPLHCWQDSRTGQYEAELALVEDTTLSIRNQDSETDLAAQTIKLAWVYKRRRASVSWRLF